MKQNQKKKNLFEDKSLMIWKMSLASALAWEISKWAGSQHPYLAPLSVILCLQTTIDQSIRYSIHRVVGTVIGIILISFLTSEVSVNGWILGLLILIGSFIAKSLKLDETVIHQVALTILLVFVFEHKSGDYGIDRIRDTLIGAGLAVIIHMFIFPPNFTKQAKKTFDTFQQHLYQTFQETAFWIESGCDKDKGNHLELEVKEILKELHKTNKNMQTALGSLKYNPFAKKDKVDLLSEKEKVKMLKQGYGYLENSIETFKEWGACGTMSGMDKQVWSNQMYSLSSFMQDGQAKQVNLPPLRVEIPGAVKPQRFAITLYQLTKQFLNKAKQLN